MPVPTAVKVPMNTATIPLHRNTVSIAPPSIKLAVTVLPVLPMLVPLLMKATTFLTVPGQTTAEVSTDDPCTARTADTAIMNIPTTVCRMVHGHLPVHLSIKGRYPAPAATAQRRRQAII